MYKLVAIDMDGTLLNSDYQISQANSYAIQQAIDMGVKIVLASGRPLIGFKKFLEELDLISKDNYAISYNGSLVQATKGNEIIFKKTLTLDNYKDLYNLSKKLNVNIHALTDTTITTPKNSKYTIHESEINNIPIDIIPVEDVSTSTSIVKVMFVDEPEILDRVFENIPKELFNKYTIVRSTPFYLEFINKSVNKGVGVVALAEKLNIKQEEIMCIGDAGNDIHMIKYAGLGVAMGNAFPEIKDAADFVTKTNNQDGVAYVFNKFILDIDKELAV
ncbi:sugar-phosphatase [Clostridium frigoris]|uniref:Sugar-phosphatase n=1 Tax=Clostridium frigoris TaxID=205327 RepID=A0ABS6BUY6_9CLOT|nr:sugar-phosphatase [Clostridium frigoris]MBU3160305.1 sugar-phosphatase [Clostridium frigoris]